MQWLAVTDFKHFHGSLPDLHQLASVAAFVLFREHLKAQGAGGQMAGNLPKVLPQLQRDVLGLLQENLPAALSFMSFVESLDPVEKWLLTTVSVGVNGKPVPVDVLTDKEIVEHLRMEGIHVHKQKVIRIREKMQRERPWLKNTG